MMLVEVKDLCAAEVQPGGCKLVCTAKHKQSVLSSAHSAPLITAPAVAAARGLAAGPARPYSKAARPCGKAEGGAALRWPCGKAGAPRPYRKAGRPCHKARC